MRYRSRAEGPGFHIHTAVASDEVRVTSLASGSSGNAVLVQAGATNILIDAGLGVRALASHLSKRGVGTGNLHGILLTHEHSDHTQGAGALARRTSAPIIGNRATLAAYASRDERGFPERQLDTGGSLSVGTIGVRSFAVPHDAAEPVGYVLEIGAHRVTYFTDAGSPTEAMRQALIGANLAIVEANHDLEWLRRGPYTAEMKARVESSTGHLSNHDCADLIAERLDCGGAMCVWLAHLSRVNNAPALAKRTVMSTIAESTRVQAKVEVALRDSPSVTWRAGHTAIQLTLL